jgi:hypothetical protein
MTTPTTSTPDVVDILLGQLKALPLIDSADLDAPFAAYAAFELVLSAITRAALVQVPERKRRGQERAPVQAVRCGLLPCRARTRRPAIRRAPLGVPLRLREGKTDGPVHVTHNHPEAHWQRARNAQFLLDLQSLIADFREAVDNLGGLLRSTPDMLQIAHDELASREVQLVPVHLTRSSGGAHAATGTK